MSDEKISSAARILSAEGASKGGKARAAALSPERRTEIAREAATARWSKDVPIAEYEGLLPFGGLVIPCAVLPNGVRVLSERGVTKGFGLKRAGSNWQRKNEDGARMPVFASANNLKPFIDDDLRAALMEPILYRPKKSRGSVANGVKAEIVPQICEIWLSARDAGVLKLQQSRMAIQADIVMRGLATVGIVALVDEVTGYQADRSADAMEKMFRLSDTKG